MTYDEMMKELHFKQFKVFILFTIT